MTESRSRGANSRRWIVGKQKGCRVSWLPECRLHRVDIKRLKVSRESSGAFPFQMRWYEFASSPVSPGELTKHDAISRNETLPFATERTLTRRILAYASAVHFRFWLGVSSVLVATEGRIFFTILIVPSMKCNFFQFQAADSPLPFT